MISLDNQTFQETDSYFQKALLAIKDNLNLFYSKYADETGLSIQQTAVRVSKWDLNQWKNVVSSFDMSDWSIEAKDRVQTYGVQAGHDRTALIGAIIGINLVDASVKVQRATQNRLDNDSDDEVKRLKKQASLTKKQSKKVSSVITDPDNVALWSKNLWLDHDELADDIQKMVNKHLKHGMDLDDMHKLFIKHVNKKQFKPNQSIADRIKQMQNNAHRIVRTESARLVDHANMTTFKMQHVKHVAWLTEPGACDLCLELEQGSPYDLDKAPLIPDNSHPNCRCMKVPFELI